MYILFSTPVGSEESPLEPKERRPYSPFTPETKGQWAVARLDDALNWCRKVTFFFINNYCFC